MTEDLPTPPLPLAIAYTLVSEPGWANGISRSCLAAAQPALQLAALLLAHHVEVDLDPADAGQLADGAGDVAGDGVAQRAARHRQPDVDPDGPVGRDLHVLDHAQLGDRAVDLGVVDAGQGLGHLLDGGR